MYGNQVVVKFLQAAAEATVFVSPCDYGLDHGELVEIARREEFQDGEIGDAIKSASLGGGTGKRDYMISDTTFMSYFNGSLPSNIDINAVEFVFQHLRKSAKAIGVQQARFTREALCSAGEQMNIPTHQTNVALTCMLLGKLLIDRENLIGFAPNRQEYPSPKEQQSQGIGRRERKDLDRAIPIVKDVISRRSDGRPAAADPYDSFTNTLGSLDFAHFKAWWIQTLAELKPLSPVSHPTSQIVLAAALAEAALCFVLPRAQKEGLMRDLEIEHPRRWSFDGLIKAAAKSAGTAGHEILGGNERSRALQLNTLRQRIHAGALIEQFQGKLIPDIRPEEATEAVAISKMVVRQVLDWLAKHSN